MRPYARTRAHKSACATESHRARRWNLAGRLLFYSSARLDGLEERFEEFGTKVSEHYKSGCGGKTGHLIFRSVCYDTTDKTPEELRRLQDEPLTNMRIRKMTEKYERDPEVPVETDVWKKTFYYRDFQIKYSYHHQPGRITRRTRLFSKAEEEKIDPLERRPIEKKMYDEVVKMPKVLEDEMKECLTNMKEAEHEAKVRALWRVLPFARGHED